MCSQGLDVKKFLVHFNGLPPFSYGANYQSLLCITLALVDIIFKTFNFLGVLLSSRSTECHLPDRARLQTYLTYRPNRFLPKMLHLFFFCVVAMVSSWYICLSIQKTSGFF